MLTQRDFQPFPNFNFASRASTRCYTAVTPSTWPCESLRVSRERHGSFATPSFDAGPPPDLDKMDSAPRFVAENCALKGVDALMKLAIAYIGINRLDGAAECLTCVARACAKP